MLKQHIFEHCGVMLHVDYTMTGGTLEFRNIQVMDSNYRPTGPDLRPLLHQALIVDRVTRVGDRFDAETFLSAIARELP